MRKKIALAAFELIDKKLFDFQKFILNDLKSVVDDIYIITSEYLSNSDLEWIKSKDIIFIKSNHVIDIFKWKDAINYLFSNNSIYSITSLTLLNDSFFGPFKTFKSIYADMDKYNYDFWGITSHGEMCTSEGKFFPQFIQRYFSVYSKKVLCSNCFIDFWNNITNENEMIDEKTEFVFTKYLEDEGFRWGVYCDTSKVDICNPQNYISNILFRPYRLISEFNLPILSRFLFDIPREVELAYHLGDELKNALEYIKNETAYNMNYINRYVIENVSPFDVKNKYGLEYILPHNSMVVNKRRNAVLLVHLFYEDLFVKLVPKLLNVPVWIHIIITTNSYSKKTKIIEICKENKIRNYEIDIVLSKGREWSAFLIGVKEKLLKYDYIGFIHDKKSSQLFYSTVGESFNDFLWNNMIDNEAYIESIFEQFDSDDNLGILSPEIVYHGEYWCHYSDFWTICFDGTRELAKRIGIDDTKINHDPIITIGSCFWARKNALKKLLEYNFVYNDFQEEPIPIDGALNHFLERIIAYVARDAGYYTGSIINQEYAQLYLINYEYMLRKILIKETENGTNVTTFNSMLESLEEKKKPISSQNKFSNTIKCLYYKMINSFLKTESGKPYNNLKK